MTSKTDGAFLRFERQRPSYAVSGLLSESLNAQVDATNRNRRPPTNLKTAMATLKPVKAAEKTLTDHPN